MTFKFRAATLAFVTAALTNHAIAQDAPDASTVVATVNGQEITLGHVAAKRQSLPQQYQQQPNSQLFPWLVARLVQEALLAQALVDRPAMIDLMIENQERQLMAFSLANQIAQDAVTDETLAAAYEARYAAADLGKEYNASHILVATIEEAQAVVAELEAGADFAGLARERSTGPSGPNGGLLGWFGVGAMVPTFEEAVVALEPGAISEPVETQFGWHVIKLNESRIMEAPALADVRDELAEELQSAAVEDRINELRAAADIAEIEPGMIDPEILGDPSLLGN